MKYFPGDCIEIFSEIDPEKVEGTTITLESITDPNGVAISLGTIMNFGTEEDDLNIASITYQSEESAAPGRYKFLCKSRNGTRVNYAEGFFYIEDK